MRIPFLKPVLPDPGEWVPLLKTSYDAGRFSNFGPLHERFAEALGHRYGHVGRAVVPVANATVGLTATLQALEVRGPVLIPSFTFIATAQAVTAAGCTPVFCDVDPVTWELSPGCVDDWLSQKQFGAVIAVRAFGFARDLSLMESICASRGVPLIVDAAAALGGRRPDGVLVGGQGIAEVFSLHATKVAGIGEGGAVFCAPELESKIRRAINFGLEDGDVRASGTNGKLSEFSCAVGLAMLEHLDGEIDRRQRHVTAYRELLSGLERAGHIGLPAQTGTAPWQTFPVEVRGGMSNHEVIAAAREVGLELRAYYHPALHRTRLYRANHGLRRLPVTDRLSETMTCLPVYPAMDHAVLDEVSAILGGILCQPIARRLRI